MDQKLPDGPSGSKNKKRSFPLPLFILVFLVLIGGIAATVYLVTTRKTMEPPSKAAEQQQESGVSIQNIYKNPFKKESQYVNAFDQFKSPMLGLKEEK